jgi:glycosyltransferase involved in cell wall biosynthesis
VFIATGGLRFGVTRVAASAQSIARPITFLRKLLLFTLSNSVQSMILLHISTDSRTLGFVLQQMLLMRGKGWKVHAMASPGKYESTLQIHSIPFHSVAMHPRISPLRDLLAIPRIWAAMWRLRPVIVHVHTLKAGLLAMISATMARIPIRVFHVHGLPHLAARGFKYRLLLWSTRLACMLSHRVFCVSSSIRQILIDQHLCPENKAVVPANGSCDGIDAVKLFNPSGIAGSVASGVRASYRVPLDAFAIGFVGRLVCHKGLVELCEAWTVLRSDYPDLHLFIVGDFEAQDPVPSRTIESFRTDPRVHMTGLCRNMPELYAAIDLAVLPSYYEGFPTVLLEAAAMSLPAVATAIPGNIDAVLDHVTGLLVPPNDASALAEAIKRYIDDPRLRENHGVRARERVLLDFRPEPIREFIYQEYCNLLSNRGLCAPLLPPGVASSVSEAAFAAADLS